MTRLEQICKDMAEQIKPCPKCGRKRNVAAVFNNNESDEIIGWIQYCSVCDNDTDVAVVSIENLDWIDVRTPCGTLEE